MPKRRSTQDLLSVAEVAAQLDLAEETIYRDLRAGAPHVKRGGRVSLDIAAYAAWRKSRQRTGKRGRPAHADSDDIRQARLRKENALAAKYELQVARERGELVAIEDVRRRWGELITTARNRLLGLGAAISPQLEGRDAAERQSIIDSRVHEILNDLSEAGNDHR